MSRQGPRDQEVTNGAARVRPISGPLNSSSNRYNVPDAVYAVGTNSVTWTSSENVTEFYVTMFADAGAMETTPGTAGDLGAVQVEKHAWMVIDAPSTAVAVLWLTKAASASADSNIYAIPYGQKIGPFTGYSYFSRLDFGTDVNAQVFVEAV